MAKTQKIQFQRRYKAPGAWFNPGDVIEIADETSRRGKKISKQFAELAVRGGAAIPYTDPPPEEEQEKEPTGDK